jgi:hypothetical protein
MPKWVALSGRASQYRSGSIAALVKLMSQMTSLRTGVPMLLESAVPSSTIFGSEFLGTMVMVMMGTGVVANVTFHKTKGYDAEHCS